MLTTCQAQRRQALVTNLSAKYLDPRPLSKILVLNYRFKGGQWNMHSGAERIDASLYYAGEDPRLNADRMSYDELLLLNFPVLTLFP